MYIPAHSDFIIHWTGKDIENIEKNKDKKNDRYLKRLYSILKWGLWMTKDDKDEIIKLYNGEELQRPSVAKTCFTELKLSQAEYHAKKFGSLGIGFKRTFLFARLGSPMFYYHPGKPKNWFFPEYMNKPHFDKKNDFFSCFYKEMCPPKGKYWKYSFFDESEWRIIYSEEIKEKLQKMSKNEIIDRFKTPEELNDEELNRYLKEIGSRPEYLIPLDAWLSMIIYPNIKVKDDSRNCKGIREMIEKIKERKNKNNISKENLNFPIELDLPACKNF